MAAFQTFPVMDDAIFSNFKCHENKAIQTILKSGCLAFYHQSDSSAVPWISLRWKDFKENSTSK